MKNVKAFVNTSEVSSETKEVVNRAIKYGFYCVYTQVNNRLPGENLTKHVENIIENVLWDIENIPGRILNGKGFTLWRICFSNKIFEYVHYRIYRLCTIVRIIKTPKQVYKLLN